MANQAGADPADGSSGDDGGDVDYAELLLRAGYNYHVFLAAMAGFLGSRGIAFDEFLEWTALHVAGSWQGLRGHGADAVLRLVLENLASTGYSILDVEEGPDVSSAVVGVIPLGLQPEQWQDLVAPFNAQPADLLVLFRVFQPLAESAGASLELEHTDAGMRLTVRRLPQSPGPQPVRFFDLG